ncbi:MAG TPA: glutamine synthetase family protein [bacterium]|nr:glutamine synthetase family protein [bacterium]
MASPSDRAHALRASPNAVYDRARAAGVRLIRVVYCDNANLIRAKAAPLEGLDVILKYGVGFSVAQQALPMLGDTPLPASGLSPIGEVWLVPDPGTFTVLPYNPGAAMTLGDFRTAAGDPWAHDPRACLRRAVEAASADGYEVQAAFEPEFYLLRPHANAAADGADYEPFDRTNFAMTIAHDAAHEILRDLVDVLNEMELDVALVYPESGPGQFEVSIRHAAALAAADRHIILREGIRGVARRHGLSASFAPEPFADSAGSGCHLHMSVWRDGQNLFYDDRDRLHLSPLAYAWIAGVLAHLPGLCALVAPSVNSYGRLRPYSWAGAFACYGPENREAAVRVITPRRGPGSCNVELKTCDGSANPYLALAGVIAAGLDGVRRKLAPGDPVETDPGFLPEEARRAGGIAPLPATLDAAIQALEGDSVIQEMLGAPLTQSFIAVRRGEWEALRGMEPAAVARRHLFIY